MKKLLFIAVCCLMLCGCENKTNSNLETTCTSNAELSDGRMNYYTWTFYHDNNTINKKSWMRSYEYKNLSEAIKEEERAKENCENTDYYCNVSRNNNIITYYISYNCGKASISNTDECNYYNEIKSLENNGFKCKED